MSYAAGRWARAHTLVLDRDSTALAVLKELADDFRDDEGRCRIESYKELALYLGIKKPDTVSAAVDRLVDAGLVRTSNIVVGRCIVGTRFELVGYQKADWPEDRQGKEVWIDFAVALGFEPQPWWPKIKRTQKTGAHQKTDTTQKTEVPRKTGEGTTKNGEGVPRKTGEGYPEKRGPFTGTVQGITGNRQGGVCAPDSEGVPEVSDDEKSHLDTNPNPAQFEGVPFPDFEETTTDDELFAPELLKTTGRKVRTHQSKEEKPKTTKTTRGTRLTIEMLPEEWRTWMTTHFPTYDPDLVFEEFLDYWKGVSGAKGVKLDWFATFRNHVRGMPEWKKKNFLKKGCEQETLPNSTEWTQERRIREGYGWATTY